MGLIPEQVLDRYDPKIVEVAERFNLDKVTDPDERQIGMSFARLAAELLQRVNHDDVCVMNGLSLLKDAEAQFVLALRHRRST
jgi:CRISPR/Cas system-associated protein Csm6